jgi:hypothetical protein
MRLTFVVYRNCNHFAHDFCERLNGKGIPNYINRLAWFSSFFQCIIPASLGLTTPTSENAEQEAPAAGAGSAYQVAENNSNWGASISSDHTEPTIYQRTQQTINIQQSSKWFFELVVWNLITN